MGLKFLIFSFFNLKLDMQYQFPIDLLKIIKYLQVVSQYEFVIHTLMQRQDSQFMVI
jgi:hypothetical protein